MATKQKPKTNRRPVTKKNDTKGQIINEQFVNVIENQVQNGEITLSEAFQLFGFQLGKKDKGKEINPSFAMPANEDGALTLQTGAIYGTYVDMDGTAKNEVELITRYREAALHPECDSAIEDIVNESIVCEEDEQVIEINLEEFPLRGYSPEFGQYVKAEFDNVLDLLNFRDEGHNIFKRWYIDGRLFYHTIIDNEAPAEGIKELRYLDPRRIRKIREQKKRLNEFGVEVVDRIDEYYVYNERGINNANATAVIGVRISEDSIVYSHSGLVESGKTHIILSHLHKALKPLNQLRHIEDAVVIYRLSRAPERRIFYIDVGNLPKIKAEQYLRDIMLKYRNKLVYDSNTGELRDDKKFLSMMEDYWLPRREGCICLDEKISLLDGRSCELSKLIEEHNSGIQNYTLSVSSDGTIVPGKISWAGITRRNSEVMKITLDNDESVTSTLDHKFILRTGEKIEAKDLKVGDSLMPLYTRLHHVSPNRKSGEYLQIFDNKSEKWKFTHTLVSDYFNRKKEINEVVHHDNLNRFDNSPKNLTLMDKKKHWALHSTMGTKSWENGNREEHCKNLSIAGKEFFETEEGLKRRQEISDNNRVNPNIVNGFTNGREKIKALREQDKLNLSKEEYLAKWSPGLAKMLENNKRIKENNLQVKAAHNHKVKSIEFLTEKIDVGTLTIDEHEEYHDYHNFALSCGIFVMNSKGTEIGTLPGGENLGEITDVEYFEQKLYRALNVPISRIKSEGGFNLGRSAEISRDEVKFYKFVVRLRKRFTQLFFQILKTQLILKGIIQVDEWENLKRGIKFKFAQSSYYSELKAGEILRERVATLTEMNPFVGTYYSINWIRKNVLKQTEDDIVEIDQQIKGEQDIMANTLATQALAQQIAGASMMALTPQAQGPNFPKSKQEEP